MEDHITRIYQKTSGDIEKFAFGLARYCAETGSLATYGPDLSRPEITILLAFDFDRQMEAGGMQEYFTNGMGSIKTLEITIDALENLDAIDACNILADALEATPNDYIETLREAEAAGDDEEYEFKSSGAEIEEEALFELEEKLDELDDAYYDLEKAMETQPLDPNIPISGNPVNEIISGIYTFASLHKNALNAVIQPVYERLKASGKL